MLIVTRIMKHEKHLLFLFFMLLVLTCCNDHSVKILVLSGSNNHDWQNTTPLIREILARHENFTVDITEKPETINSSMLKSYDVIVSNWNMFPEREQLWNPEAKQALLDFLSRGGGFVCIHGASATHYDWPPYLEITGGRWGEKTSHGPISDHTVQIVRQEHPITKGLRDFTIRDELWVDLECSPNIEVLCVAQAEKYKNTPGKLEPVVLITQYGRGRGYYLALGHDTTAMSHPDWQRLLIRGTEWVSKRKVYYNQ